VCVLAAAAGILPHRAGARGPNRDYRGGGGVSDRKKRMIKQFCAYAAVGGVSVVCEWTLFAIFFSFRWHYIDAVIVSFSIATVINLLLGRRFPFKASKISKFREATLIIFVSVIGLGINILLMAIFYSTFGWNVYFSKVLASAIVFCWNFSSRRFYIYRDI
jgi:putative flippase GtrA